MKLFYFTLCYPFGMGEQWKTNELNVLVRHFDEITVVPYFYGGNFDHPKTLPPGVKLLGPLFHEVSVAGKKSDALQILFHKNGNEFISEFFAKKVYQSRKHLQSWVGATLNIIRLLKHPIVKEIVAKADKQTVLYFYWGKGSSEVLPFIDTSRFHKVFVRMHRFDLFEYVNNHYIPYRKSLMNNISVAAPVSFAGKQHLEELYPEVADRIRVVRIGTLDNGKRCLPSTDGVLRVLSCSALSSVKRVRIMIESLPHVDFPIMWRHIGGGSQRKELQQLAETTGVAEKFIFEGKMDTEHIMDFYTGQPFDLFINTSESEGVPVSIMEAFAAGIPAMATDVGGTREIVNESVGRLLPADITGAELASELKSFHQLSPDTKAVIRQNAFESYQKNWNAAVLAEELGAFLHA